MTAILWKHLSDTVLERSRRYDFKLSKEDVEDISQDALMKLLNIPGSEKLGLRRAYIDRVVRSAVWDDHKRRRRAVKQEPLPDDLDQDDPAYWAKKQADHDIRMREKANRLLDCVKYLKRELPPDHFVGAMAPITGNRGQRVADDVGAARRTVVRRTSKAQQMARDWWNKNYGEEP